MKLSLIGDNGQGYKNAYFGILVRKKTTLNVNSTEYLNFQFNELDVVTGQSVFSASSQTLNLVLRNLSHYLKSWKQDRVQVSA